MINFFKELLIFIPLPIRLQKKKKKQATTTTKISPDTTLFLIRIPECLIKYLLSGNEKDLSHKVLVAAGP